MNKQNIPAPLDENRIEELLTKIQPKPSTVFFKKIEQAAWKVIPEQQIRMKKLSSRFTFAMALLFLFIAILATTPPGRAWAQEMAKFFARINSETVHLPPDQLLWRNEIDEQPYDLPLIPVFIPEVSPEMALIPGCETPQKSQSYHCQVALAEAKLGLDLLELSETPDDWEFKSLDFNPDLQTAVLTYDVEIRTDNPNFYSRGQLIFRQGVGDFSDFHKYIDPWEAVPANKVEQVFVGKYKGEYVRGRFGLPSNSDTLIWTEEYREQRLKWSDGTRWYSIELSPNLNIVSTMGKDELIHLAESLVTAPVETTKPLNPDHLLSISEAETISGLDLKAPTLLPMDVEFSHARYSPGKQQIQLVYGYDEGLVIREWKGEPVEFKKPLGKYEFTCEIVSVNYEDAFYCFVEGPNPRSFMWWQKDGLNYEMSTNFFFGGRIDREKAILIAESMQDIDDFFKKDNKNYEWIVLYEQGLGMDIKKFTEVPAGWEFASFWSDIRAKCISLVYTTTAGRGHLFISQCKTDNQPDTSIFPFGSVKRVKVGDFRGNYIAGASMTLDDGKHVWDPNAPRKQLYWQENGLWIQFIVYGENAYDKEDLISIAESLH